MSQIKAYHRPTTIDEALQLMAQPSIHSTVVAGGTYIIPRLKETVEAVVDLQAVGLTGLDADTETLTAGAMVTLQTLVNHVATPSLLREAILYEGPNTFRHAGTVGGSIISANKESEFVAALLVFEAQVTLQSLNGTRTMMLTDFLKDMPSALEGGLITAVSIATGGKTASARVARTPMDSPIVAALARRSAGGSVQLALCGVAYAPVLVDPASDIKAAINPPADFRGSAEYRRQMAATLSRRVLAELD
jgi:CO/xanthine dehydrogenase FAD-binding subunit